MTILYFIILCSLKAALLIPIHDLIQITGIKFLLVIPYIVFLR